MCIIQSSLESWWILGFFELSNWSLEHLAIVNFTCVYLSALLLMSYYCIRWL